MALDPHTIFLVLAVVVFVLGAAQFGFYLLCRRDTWFLYWGAGDLCVTTAVILFSQFQHLPLPLAVPLTNSFLVLAWGLCWSGCRVFCGHRPLLAIPLLAAAAVFAILAIGSPVSAHLAGRLLVVSAAMDIFVVIIAWELLQTGRNEGLLLARICAGIAAGIAAVIVIRALWGASVLNDAIMMQHDSPLGMLLLPSVAVALAWNVCLTLMTAERMRGILLHDACCDELTQVLNRRGVRVALWHTLRRVASNETAALVLLDLDYLKTVNDTFGHAVGDSLLRCLAQSADTQLRLGDSVGRIGGDEFAVILRQVDQVQATAITERLRAEFAGAAAALCPNFSPTISVGIAYIQRDERSIDQIIARADRSLYQAKEARLPRSHSRRSTESVVVPSNPRATTADV